MGGTDHQRPHSSDGVAYRRSVRHSGRVITVLLRYDHHVDHTFLNATHYRDDDSVLTVYVGEKRSLASQWALGTGSTATKAPWSARRTEGSGLLNDSRSGLRQPTDPYDGKPNLEAKGSCQHGHKRPGIP